jgi:UDP-N-acetyl-D-mannosaminuronate dehydrogenase
MTSKAIVVIGLGEIGKPLLEIISRTHHAIGVDLDPPAASAGEVDVMHICFPFQISDFIGETIRYIKIFNPKLIVINSTVAIGTTREIANRSGCAIVNSPVRGKHVRMVSDMMKYVKFVGAMDPADGIAAARHFESIGLATKILSSPETTELAKLTETSYFGLMIAWAQQVERYCDRAGASYEEVISFYEEISFFPPVKYFPGVIGGHCVMPNIELLSRFTNSELVDSIRASNEMKIAREKQGTSQLDSRVALQPSTV